MATFIIETMEHHQQILKQNREQIDAINFDDPSWSSRVKGMRYRGHAEALEALELGRQYGSTEPAVVSQVLIDSEGRNIGATQEQDHWFQVQWVLPKEAAAQCGRSCLPIGENSRELTGLGLREVVAVVTIERNTEVFAVAGPNRSMRAIHVKGAPVLAVIGQWSEHKL
jgi:hypothetical protein